MVHLPPLRLIQRHDIPLREVIWILNDSGMSCSDYIRSINHIDKADMGVGKSVVLSCREKLNVVE